MTGFPASHAIVALFLGLVATTSFAQEIRPSRYEEALSGATLLGRGEIAAYRNGDRFLVELQSERFGRLVLWHVEAVEMPTDSDGHNQIGTTVVSLERHGSSVYVRDRAPGFQKRAGHSPSDPDRGPSVPRPSDAGVEPIHSAVSGNTNAPIIAVMPIVAESSDGRLLVDVTKLFSSDIESLSAKQQVAFAKMKVKAVDPTRSFIKDIRVSAKSLSITSQLTFLAANMAIPSSEPVPVTIGVANWFVPLADTPMRARYFDGRVGYFHTKFVEYESAAGHAYSRDGVIWRHRLEKADPTAPVSDPVKPIVFYVGRDVPARWRPYVRAGIEAWRPAFEAAGFRNAIVARDAPSQSEDPNWAADDAEINVVRWLPTNTPNAIGPTIYDPRSGEIIGSHVQIFPRIAPWVSSYYYLMAKGLDPEVKGLPLREEVLGRLLAYIVAHEVGHGLGLRHNHLASTAYSVAELRDRAFTNHSGPNSSIMAYGRLNQAAQPGDGVTRVIGGLGPYDYFAINWGYGVHGSTPAEEQEALDRMAAVAAADPQRRWAAGEAPDEDQWKLDPRVLKENVGQERVEATRLGVAKLVSSLASLPDATDDQGLLLETYNLALYLYASFVSSLGGLIGGTIIEPNGTMSHPSLEQQRSAIRYGLGEGARSLDAFLQPDLVARTRSAGVLRRVSETRARVVEVFLNAQRLSAVEEQAIVHGVRYSLFDYLDDVADAIWGELSDLPEWRRELQSAYVRSVQTLLRPVDSAAQKTENQKLRDAGYSDNYALLAVTTGRDTTFPDWAAEALPQLVARLESAAQTAEDRRSRSHLRQMGGLLRRIADSEVKAPAGSALKQRKLLDGPGLKAIVP